MDVLPEMIFHHLAFEFVKVVKVEGLDFPRSNQSDQIS